MHHQAAGNARYSFTSCFYWSLKIVQIQIFFIYGWEFDQTELILETLGQWKAYSSIQITLFTYVFSCRVWFHFLHLACIVGCSLSCYWFQRIWLLLHKIPHSVICCSLDWNKQQLVSSPIYNHLSLETFIFLCRQSISLTERLNWY